MFGGLLGVAGVAGLSGLVGGLHVLLAASGLFASGFRSVGGLLHVERLLTEAGLGLRHLLPQLAGGRVQLFLTLLLRGSGGSGSLSQLLELLRELLLLLSQLGRLLSETGIRLRVLLQ